MNPQKVSPLFALVFLKKLEINAASPQKYKFGHMTMGHCNGHKCGPVVECLKCGHFSGGIIHQNFRTSQKYLWRGISEPRTIAKRLVIRQGLPLLWNSSKWGSWFFYERSRIRGKISVITFFNKILIIQAVENWCIKCPVGQKNTRQHGQFVPLRLWKTFQEEQQLQEEIQ